MQACVSSPLPFMSLQLILVMFLHYLSKNPERQKHRSQNEPEHLANYEPANDHSGGKRGPRTSCCEYRYVWWHVGFLFDALSVFSHQKPVTLSLSALGRSASTDTEARLRCALAFVAVFE